MPRIAAEQAGGANVCAFLDMIAHSEIGDALLARSDDGYNVLVGSTARAPLLFSSYATHPDVYSERYNSTAAGRYQILSRYWPHYRDLLKLPDFGPESQDRYAIQQIRECKALPMVVAGDFVDAVHRVANIWASLPGAGYGQHENEISDLRDAYVRSGGSLSACSRNTGATDRA